MPLYGTTLGAAYYSGQTITLDAIHGPVIERYDGIGGGTTPVYAHALRNLTPATALATVQNSPAIEFEGTVWDGAASQTQTLSMYLKPFSAISGEAMLTFAGDFFGGLSPSTTGVMTFFGSGLQINDPSNSAFVYLDSAIGTEVGYGTSMFAATNAGCQIQSPSAAGIMRVDDSVGSRVKYGSNDIIFDSANVTMTIGGTGSFEIIHNGTGYGCEIFVGSTSTAGFTIAPGGLTVYRPGAVFPDSGGTLRFGTDYIGYPSLGSLFTFFEDWSFSLPGALSQVSPLAGAGRWSLNFFNASSGYLAGTSPAGYAPPTVQIVSGSVSGASKAFLGTTRALVQAATNSAIVTAEWDFDMAAVGANNFDVYAGWASNRDFTTASPTTVGGVYFMKRTGDTQWQCVVDNGTTRTITASGVTPVANTMNTLKIDWFGSTTYQGTFAVFWIDGVRVATISATTYAGAAFFSAGAKNASSGATMAMQLGSVEVIYNRFNAPPLPS